MRIIGMLILTVVAFTVADPPPPYAMNIYINDGTSATFWCSELDPEGAITFDRLQMKVVQCILDPATQLPVKTSFYYCTSQVDSITFTPLAAPAQPPKRSATKPVR